MRFLYVTASEFVLNISLINISSALYDPVGSCNCCLFCSDDDIAELESLCTRIIFCVRFWSRDSYEFSNKTVRKLENGPSGSTRIVTKS